MEQEGSVAQERGVLLTMDAQKALSWRERPAESVCPLETGLEAFLFAKVS